MITAGTAVSLVLGGAAIATSAIACLFQARKSYFAEKLRVRQEAKDLSKEIIDEGKHAASAVVSSAVAQATVAVQAAVDTVDTKANVLLDKVDNKLDNMFNWKRVAKMGVAAVGAASAVYLVGKFIRKLVQRYNTEKDNGVQPEAIPVLQKRMDVLVAALGIGLAATGQFMDFAQVVKKLKGWVEAAQSATQGFQIITGQEAMFTEVGHQLNMMARPGGRRQRREWQSGTGGDMKLEENKYLPSSSSSSSIISSSSSSSSSSSASASTSSSVTTKYVKKGKKPAPLVDENTFTYDGQDVRLPNGSDWGDGYDEEEGGQTDEEAIEDLTAFVSDKPRVDVGVFPRLKQFNMTKQESMIQIPLEAKEVLADKNWGSRIALYVSELKADLKLRFLRGAKCSCKVVSTAIEQNYEKAILHCAKNHRKPVNDFERLVQCMQGPYAPTRYRLEWVVEPALSDKVYWYFKGETPLLEYVSTTTEQTFYATVSKCGDGYLSGFLFNCRENRMMALGCLILSIAVIGAALTLYRRRQSSLPPADDKKEKGFGEERRYGSDRRYQVPQSAGNVPFFDADSLVSLNQSMFCVYADRECQKFTSHATLIGGKIIYTTHMDPKLLSKLYMKWVDCRKKIQVQVLQPCIDECIAANLQGWVMSRRQHHLNTKRSLEWKPISECATGQLAVTVWIRDKIKFGFGNILTCNDSSCTGSAPTVRGHCGSAWVDWKNQVYFVHIFGDARGNSLRNGGLRPGMFLDGVSAPEPTVGVQLDNPGTLEMEWIEPVSMFVAGGSAAIVGSKLMKMWKGDRQVDVNVDSMEEQKFKAEKEAKTVPVQEDVCLNYWNGDCQNRNCSRCHVTVANVTNPELKAAFAQEHHLCYKYYTRGVCDFERKTGRKCRWAHPDRKLMDDLEARHFTEKQGAGRKSSGQRGGGNVAETYAYVDTDFYAEPMDTEKNEPDNGEFDGLDFMDDRTAGPTAMSAIGKNRYRQKGRTRQGFDMEAVVPMNVCPAHAIHAVCVNGRACALRHIVLGKQETASLVQQLKLAGCTLACPLKRCTSGVDCPFVHRPAKYKDGPGMLETTMKAKQNRQADRKERLQKLRKIALSKQTRAQKKEAFDEALEDFDSDDESGNEQQPEGSLTASSREYPKPFRRGSASQVDGRMSTRE